MKTTLTKIERIPKSYYDIPFINIENYQFDNTINLISKSFALKNSVIPMELNGNNLTVCMSNPNIELYDKLKSKTKKYISVFKGCSKEIKKQINLLY